jgi:predicted aspartyl protease
MTGWVTEDGTPCVLMHVLNQDWVAVVDTGFNKDFELPEALFDQVVVRHIGSADVVLAGGRLVQEEFYQVRLLFDGEFLDAEASFIANDTILVGTRILSRYVLHIDFPNRLLELR